MFPPVHPALAYLLYSVGRRAIGRGTPGGPATAALLVGGVLPDLIDQFLYHLLFDLPSTRTLGHSLLFVVPVCLAVLAAVRRAPVDEAVGWGFTAGLLSHPLADAVWPLVLGKHAELGFLLWPLVHSPSYVGRKPLFSLGDVVATTLWVELPILALALVAWWRDGLPGTGWLGS